MRIKSRRLIPLALATLCVICWIWMPELWPNDKIPEPTSDRIASQDLPAQTIAPRVIAESSKPIVEETAPTRVAVDLNVELKSGSELAAKGRAEIRIVVEHEGRPVPGVRIQSTERDGQTNIAVSDSNGVASLRARTGLEYDIFIEGGFVSEHQDIRVADLIPDEVRLLRVALIQNRTIDVQVFAEDSGKPVLAAEVFGLNLAIDPIDLGRTDADGLISIPWQRGLFAIQVNKDGYLPDPVEVPRPRQADTLRNVIVWMHRSAQLDVLVRNQVGNPTPGCFVTVGEICEPETYQPAANSQRTYSNQWIQTTGEGGRASFDLPPNLELVVTSLDLPTNEVPITLSSAERRELELQVVPEGAPDPTQVTGSIIGTLVNSKYEPVSTDLVAVKSSDESRMLTELDLVAATCESNRRGEFRFDDLPVGQYLVGHSPNTYGGRLIKTYASDGQAVEVLPGENKMELVLPPELIVKGELIHKPEFWGTTNVLFRTMRSNAWILAGAYTDGSFRTDPIPAGDYEFVLTNGYGGVLKTFNATAGDDNVRVDVSDIGGLHLVVSPWESGVITLVRSGHPSQTRIGVSQTGLDLIWSASGGAIKLVAGRHSALFQGNANLWAFDPNIEIPKGGLQTCTLSPKAGGSLRITAGGIRCEVRVAANSITIGERNLDAGQVAAIQVPAKVPLTLYVNGLPTQQLTCEAFETLEVLAFPN